LKRNLVICIISVLISTSLFIINAESSEPKTIYVDDIPGEGPNNPPEDFTNIQDAIDAADNGDIIFVYSGNYSSEVLIKKSINLIGENREETILQCNGWVENIRILTNYVTISNFTFIGGHISGGVVTIHQTNNTIVEHNIFIHIDSPIKIERSQNNTIRNNAIRSGNRGSSISLSSSCHNVIEYNTIFDNKYDAVSIHGNSDHNIVSNNILSNNGNAGIYLWNSSYNILTKNTINNNKNGIQSSDCKENVYSENLISNNECGIAINGRDNHVVISNNIIKNNSHVGILSFDTRGLIKRNNFEDNWAATFIAGGDEMFINENNFLNHNPNLHFVKSNKNPNAIQWDGNYWDNWQFKSPKPILGMRFLPIRIAVPLPSIDFDRNPTQEPYDISI
jgi:parallel beta-helix repeat protein